MLVRLPLRNAVARRGDNRRGSIQISEFSEPFQPFGSVGKAGGTGLGLAYCRRVMRAFGGEIECESVLGEYTQFTLRFPKVNLLESQSHHLAVMERARAAFAGKRLLIVDDDAAQRKTTRSKLAPLGAQIDEAADGHGPWRRSPGSATTWSCST